MTESKKGHNFAIRGLTKKKKKKIPVRLFFVLFCIDATYKISSP